jgi:serine protease Do
MKRNAVAWVAVVLSSAALLSSQGVMRRAPAAREIPAEGQKTAKALSEAFEAVAEFIKPSVVQVNVTHKLNTSRSTRRGPFMIPSPDGRMPKDLPKDFEDMLRRFFGPDFRFEDEQFGMPFTREGTGSGFVFDDKGHILTNAHVVQGADKITVTFHDGTEASATVVGTDPDTDVAVIKTDQTGYPPARLGQSSTVRVGEWVLAAGSPFGLEQTVTAGIISATQREAGITRYESFLQTDASINPGNSGGPLVDLNGRVIGINTAIVTASRSNAGVGFAIPIDMAAPLATKLIKDGKVSRARLGVMMNPNPLTPELAKQLGIDPKTKGVVVTDVVAGSPAAKAGLKPGDVIIKFNDKPTFTNKTLAVLVGSSEVGKSYELTFLRDGQPHTVSVVPAPEDKVTFEAERKQEKEGPRNEVPETDLGAFGLTVQPLTPELADQFGYRKGTKGLVITSVKEGSPAEAAGLEVGHLISKVIKDKKLQSIDRVQDLRDLANKANDLALFVQTPDGLSRFVTLSKAKNN